MARVPYTQDWLFDLIASSKKRSDIRKWSSLFTILSTPALLFLYVGENFITSISISSTSSVFQNYTLIDNPHEQVPISLKHPRRNWDSHPKLSNLGWAIPGGRLCPNTQLCQYMGHICSGEKVLLAGLGSIVSTQIWREWPTIRVGEGLFSPPKD